MRLLVRLSVNFSHFQSSVKVKSFNFHCIYFLVRFRCTLYRSTLLLEVAYWWGGVGWGWVGWVGAWYNVRVKLLTGWVGWAAAC